MLLTYLTRLYINVPKSTSIAVSFVFIRLFSPEESNHFTEITSFLLYFKVFDFLKATTITKSRRKKPERSEWGKPSGITD